MKTKSQETYNDAVKILSSENFSCTTSVHCFYYSVLQKMKYILAHTKNNPISYDKQQETGGVSTHKYIFEEIKKRINASNKDKLAFVEEFNKLRQERKEADYTARIFTREEVAESREKANSLRSKLNTYFGNL